MIKFKSLKWLVPCAVFFGTLSSVCAQDKTITRRRIEIKQAGDEDNGEKNYEPLADFGVTVDPIRIISGEFPVSLQYAPLDWLIVEAGTGLTTQHYVANMTEIFSGFYSPSDASSTKVNLNPMMSLGVKLFPEADVFDDSYYFALEYRYRNYSTDVTFEGNQANLYTLTQGVKIKDLGFLYGYQYATYVDNLFIDYYIGISLRFIEENALVGEYNNQGVNYEYHLEQEERQSLGVLAGLKIGYNF